MPEPNWIVVTRAIVHPWLCDAQGHLNTRHHAALFDEASWLMIGLLGYRAEDAARDNLGWADVRHFTEFKREAKVGAFLRIEGRVVKLGRASMTLEVRMLDSDTSEEVARFEAVTVAYDLATRRSRPLPEVVRQAATRHVEMN